MDFKKQLEENLESFLTDAGLAMDPSKAVEWMQAASAAYLMLQMRELTGATLPSDLPSVTSEFE